jgi:microcystin-dependent protein
MPTVNLSSFAGAGSQFFDNSGVPLAGGLIYSYLAGTTTPLVTYTSSTGLTAHPNPIVLDSAGRINEVWVAEGTNCKFVLKTSTNVLIGTYDSLFPIASLPVSIYNGGTGATTAEGARINLGLGTFLVPTGSLIMWPSVTIPTDWKLCNGDAISRTTFATLYSLIGTTFGVGDGTTTFNLPNYKNRMPYGADTVAIGATGGSANAIVVSHTHTGTTGGQSVTHNHGVVGTTGGQSAQHNHSTLDNTGSGGTIYQNVGGLFGSDWQTAAYGSTANGTYVTGLNSVDHNHNLSFTSGNNSVDHNYAFTTDSAGSSGTNANLPPYLGINFIIKT